MSITTTTTKKDLEHDNPSPDQLLRRERLSELLLIHRISNPNRLAKLYKKTYSKQIGYDTVIEDLKAIKTDIEATHKHDFSVGFELTASQYISDLQSILKSLRTTLKDNSDINPQSRVALINTFMKVYDKILNLTSEYSVFKKYNAFKVHTREIESQTGIEESDI